MSKEKENNNGVITTEISSFQPNISKDIAPPVNPPEDNRGKE